MPEDHQTRVVFDRENPLISIWMERLALPSTRVMPVSPQPEHLSAPLSIVEPDGTVSTGVEALFVLMHRNCLRSWPLWLYRRAGVLATSGEWLFRRVTERPELILRVASLLHGPFTGRPSYFLTRRVFLGGLGIIYCIAFLSLSQQITGLIGEQGILPVDQFLSAVHQQFGPAGWVLFPSVFWIDHGDLFLRIICYIGIACSITLVIGITPRLVAMMLWACYLSVYMVGQDFLAFQWDILLLEAGFLGMLLAPFTMKTEHERAPRMLLLVKLLLFRLMFQSGIVKLTSGDRSWSDLTALTYHFHTQCIPTPVAWYAQHLPVRVLQTMTAIMFVVEIAVPFLIFAPRRVRMIAGSIMIGLQVIIALTGNYTFFNYLTIVLCLVLFDDRTYRRVLPPRMKERRASDILFPPRTGQVQSAVIVVAVLLNTIHLAGLVVEPRTMPGIMRDAVRWSSHYGIMNSYGLFRVMTKTRPEIIVEGSNDGEHWREYEFRYKPGDTLRSPPWVAPHQPRLDWQMWFAALGDYRDNRWFLNFMVRLLQGSPPVLRLIGTNPFPDHPPRFVRALLYDYRFTGAEHRAMTGEVWERTYLGIYMPPIRLTGE